MVYDLSNNKVYCYVLERIFDIGIATPKGKLSFYTEESNRSILIRFYDLPNEMPPLYYEIQFHKEAVLISYLGFRKTPDQARNAVGVTISLRYFSTKNLKDNHLYERLYEIIDGLFLDLFTHYLDILGQIL